MQEIVVDVVRRLLPMRDMSDGEHIGPLSAGQAIGWHDIQNAYRVLALAEPGMGKPFEARERARNMRARGKEAFFFADAVKRAQAKSALWWERRILDLAQNDQGNAKAVIFGLKNRASDYWRDNTHTEVSGKMEQVHRIERVIVSPGHSDS